MIKLFQLLMATKKTRLLWLCTTCRPLYPWLIPGLNLITFRAHAMGYSAELENASVKVGKTERRAYLHLITSNPGQVLQKSRSADICGLLWGPVWNLLGKKVILPVQIILPNVLIHKRKRTKAHYCISIAKRRALKRGTQGQWPPAGESRDTGKTCKRLRSNRQIRPALFQVYIFGPAPSWQRKRII